MCAAAEIRNGATVPLQQPSALNQQQAKATASLHAPPCKPAQKPEMARRELTGALLQLKALGVDSLAEFDFPSPPPPELAAKAVEALHVLGALEADARWAWVQKFCVL